jgi:phenylalanyl-tRNA synthetase beta chain
MQFSESWLRQYVNPSLDSNALGHAMTMAGLEVEEQHSVAPAFTKIVVAQILSAEQHPDADRLRVCKVDAGTGQELQIVCGAPNARVGIKINSAWSASAMLLSVNNKVVTQVTVDTPPPTGPVQQ